MQASLADSLRPSRRAGRLRTSRGRYSRLRLESLECRRLLAADDPTGGELIPVDQPLGSVHGRKWEDLNGNGLREGDEPGLAGVTIYADLNWNGVRDRGEPSAVTQRDLPETDFDESGLYTLINVPAGTQLIREVVPEGYQQTFPGANAQPVDPPVAAADDPFSDVQPPALRLPAHPGETILETVAITIHPVCFRPFEVDVVLSDPAVRLENLSGIQTNGCGGDTSRFEIAITTPEWAPAKFEIQFVDAQFGGVLASIPVWGIAEPHPQGGHVVQIEPGDGVDGIDFGNVRVPRGAIEGRKWLDRNGNGQWDAGEVGLGGVTIYADLNGNGQPDRGEPTTVTAFDDPETDFDEAGYYQLGGLRPGEYLLREVVPFEYRQTFPGPGGQVIDSQTGRLQDGVAIDLDVTDVIVRSDGDDLRLAAELEVTVVWPNSCGTLMNDRTAYTVVGQHIIVELAGYQAGAVCAEVISPQSAPVKFAGLAAGRYHVVATLHEALPDGAADVPTLTAVAQITLGGAGAHRVSVGRGELVSEIHFGNAWRAEPGSIAGLKWRDDNGNGVRDEGEPGLADVSIYVDTNWNGHWDRGEPIGTSMADDPATADRDETGYYRIDDVPVGTWRVREVVPRGYVQTYPEPRFSPPDDIWFPFPTDAAHEVTVEAGSHAGGLDFGNQPIVPAEVRGTKWLDLNGDGQRSDDEPGLAGVTIYADLNHNGQFDRGEPATRSMADDPATPDVDETGTYWLSDLVPGTVIVREVVPDGYRQTFPPEVVIEFPPPEGEPIPVPERPEDASWWVTQGRFHRLHLDSGEIVPGIDFGNSRDDLPPDVVPPHADMDGNGYLDANDINLLAAALRSNEPSAASHDLTGDRRLDQADLAFLVEDLMQSRFGDANLDGVFDSADLVQVFQAGQYEDDLPGNSGWAEGDWNGDGDFTSSDLVFALQRGGYQSDRSAARIAPWAADAALTYRGQAASDPRFGRAPERA
jgi:hypothetical protein